MGVQAVASRMWVVLSYGDAWCTSVEGVPSYSGDPGLGTEAECGMLA